jgi:hypothetical protein
VNAGQALVRAYLHLNGFLTDAELPVIRKEKDGTFRVTTDIDLLALRFPHSTRRVAKGRPGLADDLVFQVDPELDVARDAMDLIIAEVKEGRPRINPALRSRETLTTALARLGCCHPDDLDQVVERLRRNGRATAERGTEAVPCRIRILAFGDGEPGDRDGYRVVQLRRVAEFVREHLRRYRKVLHSVDLADPALGVLHLLEKLS